MHIRESSISSTLGRSAYNCMKYVVTGAIALNLTAQAIAKPGYVSYMGNDPDICGTNPKTGKANLCSKDIPLKRYSELFPGAADFYRHDRRELEGAEKLQEKIGRARRDTPKIGKIYSLDEVQKIQQLMKNWNDKDIENLAVIINPESTDEETKILIGAARGGTWHFLKSNAVRLGLDPRLVFAVVVTESRLWQESGDSGKAKTPMQILSDPRDPDNDTAGLMHKLFGRSDPYISQLGSDWRNDRNTLMILALYYLREAVKSAGCVGIPLEKLTAEQLIAIYHFYNKGHEYKGKTTWQQGNFANAMKHLKIYTKMEAFLERVKERVDSILLAQYTKKAVEEVDAQKAKEAKAGEKTQTKAEQDQAKMLKDHAGSVAMFNASQSSATATSPTTIVSTATPTVAPTTVAIHKSTAAPIAPNHSIASSAAASTGTLAAANLNPKPDQAKVPAKPDQPKTPLTSEPAKKPITTEPPKPPAKPEQPKTPVTPEQPKTPTTKAPATSEPPKPPVTPEPAKVPVTPEPRKTPITPEQSETPVTTARVLEPTKTATKTAKRDKNDNTGKPAEHTSQLNTLPQQNTQQTAQTSQASQAVSSSAVHIPSTVHASTQTASALMLKGKEQQQPQSVENSTKTVELAHRVATAVSHTERAADKVPGAVATASTAAARGLQPLVERPRVPTNDHRNTQQSKQVEAQQQKTWDTPTDRKLRELESYLAKSRETRERNGKQMKEMFRAMMRQ